VNNYYIFAPPQTPFPGGAGRPKSNQLEMVATVTYNPVRWGSMHATSSYPGNRTTTPVRNRQGAITIHCAAA